MAKAIGKQKTLVAGFAGATAFLSTLGVALTEASDGHSTVTGPEWVNIALVLLTAVGGTLGVYQVENKP